MATRRKKGVAPPRYDEAFKTGAVKLVTEQGRPSREVAKDLDFCIDTLRSWLKASAGVSTGQADRQKREAQRLRELETEVRARRQQVTEKDEVYRYPKKIRRHTFKTIEKRYRYVKADPSGADPGAMQLHEKYPALGWLYLATVKDLRTKKVVGYAFSSHIDTQLTLAALDMAVRRERPGNELNLPQFRTPAVHKSIYNCMSGLIHLFL